MKTHGSPPARLPWWWRLLAFGGHRRPGRMAPWRVRLFRLLERRERRASDYYGIPADRIVEVDTDVADCDAPRDH